MKTRGQVAITGLGVVSAAGVGVAAFKGALREGRSCLAMVDHPDLGGGEWPVGLVPDLKGSPAELGRAARLASLAATEAIENAGGWAEVSPERRGVVVGTTCGGVHAMEALAAAEESGEAISPELLGLATFGSTTDGLAAALKVEGPTLTVTLACASGTVSVGAGADLILDGQADVVLAGGVDTVSAFILKGFSALRALGELPYRIHEGKGRGLVLGEGAAFVVMESVEAAERRGAKILATVLAHAATNDGFSIARPEPRGMGLERCIRDALDLAGIDPSQIDHVNLHGTGTPGGDRAEALCLGRLLGSRVRDVPMAAVKSLVGHTSGAAGALEAVAAVLSISEGFIPAAPSVQDAPASDDQALQVVRQKSIDWPLKTVLSIGAGFGGSNAALVLGQKAGGGDATKGRGRTSAPGLVNRAAESDIWITGLGLALDGGSLPGQWLFEPCPTGTDLGEPGDVDFFAGSGFVPSKESRRIDGFGQVSLLGAARALRDGGLEPDLSETSADARVALVVGSMHSCLHSSRAFAIGLNRGRTNPVGFQNTVSNAVMGYGAMLLGLSGPSLMVSDSLGSGLAAIEQAERLIREGRSTLVLAGGADVLSSWVDLSSISPADRRLVSGAAFLLMEGAKSARKRGARPYARLVGVRREATQSRPSWPYGFLKPSVCPLGAVSALDILSVAWQLSKRHRAADVEKTTAAWKDGRYGIVMEHVPCSDFAG